MIGTGDAILFLALGLALGVVYFGLLAWTVRLFTAGNAPARVVPLYLARIVLAVVAFWFIAHHSAMALLLALAGFVVARYPVQRWGQRWGGTA
jgi:F1F0 ATPase subunit 2